MGPFEMMALSLGLSVVVAALGLAGGTLVERMSADPGLRDRVWGAALLSPLLPPVATALLLMTPAPVREVVVPTTLPVVMTSEAAIGTTVATTVAPALDMGLIAMIVLSFAGALCLLRLSTLALRAGKLTRLIRSGIASDAATIQAIEATARDLNIPMPEVVVHAAASEPLLTGLRTARLVLPAGLSPTDAVGRAVIAHELAHLKRGDHRALWIEELLLSVLAANPLMPLLRARRSAAREEACDAVALTGVGIETRRAYAQSLIEALRSRAASQTMGGLPALTFTGAGRTTAMHRLKAVLTPAAPATCRARIGAAVATCALLAVVAGGTVAVAAQREPETRVAEAAQAATRLMINGETIALDLNALPPFGLQADSVTRSAEQPGWIDFHVRLDPNAPPLSIEGVRLPAGVTTDIVSPTDVARIDRTDAGLNIVLKREAGPRSAAATRDVVVWMPVSFDGNIELKPGDRMHVTLNDGSGTMLAEAMSNGGDLRIPLTEAEFPGLGQGNRAYTLNGVILRADGSVEAADEAITVRLAPGSQRTARNMSATLSFGG